MFRKITSIQNDLNLVINDSENLSNENRYCILFKRHKGSIIRICGKVFYYILHLMLISLFETMFYFNYVSVEEDAAITGQIMGLVEPIGKQCGMVPIEIREEIIKVLEMINNTGYIEEKGEREEYNNGLKERAMIIVYGLIGICMIIGIVLWWIDKKRLSWKQMILDTIVMVGVLGMYEYGFFMNYVSKYKVIGTTEIEWNVREYLIKQCEKFD